MRLGTFEITPGVELKQPEEIRLSEQDVKTTCIALKTRWRPFLYCTTPFSNFFLETNILKTAELSVTVFKCFVVTNLMSDLFYSESLTDVMDAFRLH